MEAAPLGAHEKQCYADIWAYYCCEVGASWIATPVLAFDGAPVNQDPAYANGGGDMLAFEYFSRIVNAHGEDSPTSPQASIVANAYVAIGRYYLKGIPNSNVKADPDRARELFYHAASYFGNADAQYELARMYLKAANATPSEFTYGVRWLGLAAQKGQRDAQALLGQMLVNGDRLPR